MRVKSVTDEMMDERSSISANLAPKIATFLYNNNLLTILSNFGARFAEMLKRGLLADPLPAKQHVPVRHLLIVPCDAWPP